MCVHIVDNSKSSNFKRSINLIAFSGGMKPSVVCQVHCSFILVVLKPKQYSHMEDQTFLRQGGSGKVET